MRLVDDVKTGPACRFGDAHIYYVMHLIDREGTLSRANLARMLRIGEGSVRTIVEILRRWGMVDVRKTGISLTDEGRGFLNDISMRMVDVPQSEYVAGTYQQGILVNGVAGRITDGMSQRDRGIIAGATGASVFLLRDGSLIMPMNWNMDYRDPDFAGEIRGVRDSDRIGSAVIS